MLNILISGCGYSFSKQERKTWVNVLQSSGIKVTDVGGPAVSNQYILNKTIVELQNNKYDFVLIQLTSIGKLDVTVNQERIAELVETDSLRNFTWNGIWPSSHSDDHVSKKLYNHWLVSPELEVEDIFCKLLLLNKLYKNIIVLQAYDIPWRHSDDEIKSMFYNFNNPLAKQYKSSDFYKFHDHSNRNTVPCINYHANFALEIAKHLQFPEKCIQRIANMINKIN